MHRRRQVIGTLALVILVITAAGCGSSQGGGSAKKAAVKPDSTLAIDVGDMYIKPASTTIAAGNIAFKVTNKGAMTHEVVALKTNTPADKLTVENGRVSESDSVGEVADVASKASKSTVIKLEPGSYVLVCNITGHYSAGMRVALTVT